MMNNRFHYVLRPAIVIFLLAHPLISAQSPAQQQILFEVMAEEKGKVPSSATIEPIAIIENGTFRKPPEYDFGGEKKIAEAQELFEEEYFRRGRKYQLYMGGSAKGFVTVGEPIAEACGSVSATVTANVRLANAQMALASTKRGILRQHVDWRKPVAPEQRAEFLRLVSDVLTENKVGNFPTSKIKILEIRSTKFGVNGPRGLVGNAIISLGSDVHHVFLVATLNGAKYENALSTYHSGRGADDVSEQRESLVEQADLDGDGTDEIVSISTYYESWDYNIYKEENGVWKKVYQGGGGGC